MNIIELEFDLEILVVDLDTVVTLYSLISIILHIPLKAHTNNLMILRKKPLFNGINQPVPVFPMKSFNVTIILKTLIISLPRKNWQNLIIIN